MAPDPIGPEQLKNIQGDIWRKGFPKYYETYYFFSIDTSKAKVFCANLKTLATDTTPLISSLLKVYGDHVSIDKKQAEFKADKEAGRVKKDAILPPIPMVNALIAFTSVGLQVIDDAQNHATLNMTGISSADPAFSKGMANDTMLIDPPKDDWDDLFKSPTANRIHGLLKVAGDSKEQVDKHLDSIKKTLNHNGPTIKDIPGKSEPTETPSRVDGWTRPNDRGKEHFGFEDGISQPRMAGIDELEPEPKAGDIYAPERNMNTDPELLIVTSNTYGEGGKNQRPAWMVDGSFLVFRKLEQDVEAFRKLTNDAARYSCKNPELMGAKLMGRWKSGAPIAMPKFHTEDSDKPNDAKLMNDFGYPHGDTTCPLASHIRKTNQRRSFGDNDGDKRGPRTRIIRNGIPYGTDYKADGSDKSKRGLLFACYQGHIEDGFQHMQAGWCNSRDLPDADAGHDPIVGQVPQKSREVNGMLETTISDVNGEDQTVKVQQFVTLKGGGYFFVPSIKALTDTLSKI